MEDLDLLILIVTLNNKIVCLNRFEGVLNNDSLIRVEDIGLGTEKLKALNELAVDLITNKTLLLAFT